jgi:hypothetical protein
MLPDLRVVSPSETVYRLIRRSAGCPPVDPDQDFYRVQGSDQDRGSDTD